MCIWELNNIFSIFPLSSPSAHSEMSCQMVNFGHFEPYAQWSERGGIGWFFEIFVYAFFSIILSFYKEKRSLYEQKKWKSPLFLALKKANFGIYKGILTVLCYFLRHISAHLKPFKNTLNPLLMPIEYGQTWRIVGESWVLASACAVFVCILKTPPDPQFRTTVYTSRALFE